VQYPGTNIKGVRSPDLHNTYVMLLMRRALLVLLVFVSSASAEPAPVRVGAIFGLTGFANVWSSQARRGIEMARDEINQDGGINGRPLEVIFEDSGTTAKGGVAAFNKLVRIDKVDALVGDIISFVTLPLVPLAQANKIVLITPSIFDSDMPEKADYFFTTCPEKASIAAPVDRFFSMNPDIKRVAIICADNTWGRTYLDIWKSGAESHGIKIVDENCLDDYSSDMRAEVLRAKSKAPDGVIVAFNTDKALRRMKEVGFSPKVLTTSDIDEAINRRGFPLKEALGVHFIDWRPTPEFRKKFEARYKDILMMAPQNSYDALLTLAKALRKGDGDLQSSVRSINYIGGVGPVDFRDSHSGNKAGASLMVITERGIEELR
jgi:branched-chain amino acid transport system substrate-binding protein